MAKKQQANKIQVSGEKAPKEIPSSLELMGSIDFQAGEASEDGEDKPATFKLLANTGKPMEVSGFYDPVVVDLNGAKFDKPSTPVIQDHNTSLRIGHTTKQEVKGNKIVASGIVSATGPVAQEYVADSRRGFPFQVSIGASIKDGYFVEAGEKAEVNGKVWKGPLIVAKKTLIRELTITVLGADSGTKATIAAHHKGDTIMDKFHEWLKAMALDPEKLSEEAYAKLKAQWEAQQEPPAQQPQQPAPTQPIQAQAPQQPILDLTAQREAQALEDQRVDSIRSTIRAFSHVETVEVEEGKPIKLSSLKAKAIRDNWSPEKLDLTLRRAEMPQEPATGPAIHISQEMGASLQAQALELNLCKQMGLPMKAQNKRTGEEYGLEAQYSQQVLEAAHRPEVKAPSLTMLCDMTLGAAGKAYHGNKKDRDYIREVKAADAALKATQGFSTLAVSNILENVANKNLLSAYQAVETIWNQICGIKSLSDFKAHSFYRLDIHGGYVKVGSDGVIKHGTFGDEKFQVQADTYGMILSLTRQDIINDDLNAFSDIPQGIGRHAAIAIEEAVFTLLLANLGSFEAVATNKDLTIDGLTEAEQIFRDQLDDNKKPILVTPDRILVGSQDAVPGQRLFEQLNLMIAGASDTGAVFAENPMRNKYRPIVSTYLSNTALRKQDGTKFANQDGDQWLMFADPMQLAAILIGFLQGQQTPVIESEATAFDTLGFQYRSYHDWGVGMGNTKGAVYSPGA